MRNEYNDAVSRRSTLALGNPLNSGANIEPCPLCHESAAVRPKLLLIDEAWVDAPGKDPRLKYFANLRVDDLKPEETRSAPFEQFVSGFYCDRCGRAFVSDEKLSDRHRRYK